MKTLFALALSMALAAAPVFGGRRRVVAASPVTQDELKITFAGLTGSGSQAMVDAGAMSQAREKRGSDRHTVSVTKRVFGIRIEAANASEGATATLRAFVESYDGRSTIRIDGIEVSTVPRVIDGQMPLGIVTAHTIEIEVPGTVPEGAFASAVRWEASTNQQ